VLHILLDPISASVPGRSLEFMSLSEVSGGIFREISPDPFLRSDRQGAEVSEPVQELRGEDKPCPAPRALSVRALPG
jgi:hypothetical protein